MTLAGNMKLKNFVLILALVGVAGIAGIYLACRGNGDKPEDTKKQTLAEARPTPPPAPIDAAAAAPVAVDAAVAPAGDLAVRPYDPIVLNWQGKSITGGKKKDVSVGQPYKIDVYQDAGKSTVNRVKVDANRNNKWDDKYTFEPGKITLQHAPADDEKYSETYHWSGSRWVKGKP